MWIDSPEKIMKHIVQFEIRGRETEEDPKTYGMSFPFEVATGYTASQ